jgi:hypothetical protein
VILFRIARNVRLQRPQRTQVAVTQSQIGFFRRRRGDAPPLYITVTVIMILLPLLVDYDDGRRRKKIVNGHGA